MRLKEQPTDLTLPAPIELTDEEFLPITPPTSSSNRIVVYGSLRVGAHVFAQGFATLLEQKAIPAQRVVIVSNVRHVEEAFFNNPKSGSGVIQYSSLIADSSTLADSDQTELAVPRGVVVFPYLRQYEQPFGPLPAVHTYESRNPQGNSPFDLIKLLCDENNVPYVAIKEELTLEQLRAQLINLLPPTK